MEKDKRGKAQSYFDELDLEILELLDSKAMECVRGFGTETGYSVMDIKDKLNITHQSLKPHIDKLLSVGLISIYKTPVRNEKFEAEKDDGGNIKYKNLISSTLGGNTFWMECIFVGADEEQKDYEISKKENANIEVFMEYLRKVRELIRTNDVKKSIDYDLRAIATQEKFLNKKIGTLTEADDKKIIEIQKNAKKKIKGIIDNSRKVTTNK
jgi:DNA-binding Lrp family transcriptional regulator